MSAANKIITVLVSEPTSFADAYSLVKASYLDEKLDNFTDNYFNQIVNKEKKINTFYLNLLRK